MAYLNGSCYDFNILALFDSCAKHNFPKLDASAWEANTKAIIGYLDRICPSKTAFLSEGNNCELTFEEIDVSDHITENDRRYFYSLIIQRQWIRGIYTRISDWLGKLDAKRASLKTPSFIDEL